MGNTEDKPIIREDHIYKPHTGKYSKEPPDLYVKHGKHFEKAYSPRAGRKYYERYPKDKYRCDGDRIVERNRKGG